MNIERISLRNPVVSNYPKTNQKNCVLKNENTQDKFVKQSVSFGSTDGLIGGGFIGMFIGALAVTAFPPLAAAGLGATLINGVAASAAGAAGLGIGAAVGNKVTGKDK